MSTSPLVPSADSTDATSLTGLETEIQGLVLTAPKHPCLGYALCKVTDGSQAASFLDQFRSTGALRVHRGLHLRGLDRTRDEVCLYLAVTASGLRALGVPLDTFPAEFAAGAKARAALLGDTGDSAPAHWTSFEHDETDIVVLVYANDASALDRAFDQVETAARRNGCSVTKRLTGNALTATDPVSGKRYRREHFGFHDGISQPEILGGQPSLHPGPAPVPVGMFVLGRPDPGRGAVTCSPVPGPEGLGRLGTFGAFRVLEQDVAAFLRFLGTNHPDDPDGQARLAAKMCGRWRNGEPLALAPDEPKGLGTAPLNDFSYANDPAGLKCPIGSHIRRSYPRDSTVLGHAGERVRAIRRGMPYGTPYVPGDDTPRGVLGLFLCVSLKHQFEFLQRHWINDGLFARGLSPEQRDPLVGPNASDATFSYPVTGGIIEAKGLSRFVRTRGAAYLFFPSVAGIDQLAILARQRASATGQPTIASLTESAQIEAITRRIVGVVTRSGERDAHPKHHGIVYARFVVSAAVPSHLQRGLFAKAGEYKAYVRFSNGNPRGKHDADQDARGMAIKVMGVPGIRERLDIEQHTQDFILVNHPTFFVHDLAEYIRFQEALASKTFEDVLRDFPLVLPAFHSHNNPLAVEYFSQTAYQFGPTADNVAVKYVARPIEPALEPELTAPQIAEAQQREKDYLRTAMAGHLANREARFSLEVQVKQNPDGPHVDDPAIKWNEEPQRVAELVIPPQEFRSDRQLAFAQHISFNPWHCLVEHRPLGPFNRARRAVYLASRAARHTAKGVPHVEPDGSEIPWPPP